MPKQDTISVSLKVRHLAASAVKYLKDDGNIEISVSEFLQMVNDADCNDWIIYEADWPGAYSSPNQHLDTAVRDMVCQIFAESALGLAWPCRGDSEEVSRHFQEKLNEWVTKRWREKNNH